MQVIHEEHKVVSVTLIYGFLISSVCITGVHYFRTRGILSWNATRVKCSASCEYNALI